MTFEQVWTLITEYGIATDDEIDLVTKIDGCRIEVLNDIVFARTGYQSIEDYEESEEGIDGDGVDPDYEPADIDSDVGFDPYMGCYTDDV